jgi:hypothetical protein
LVGLAQVHIDVEALPAKFADLPGSRGLLEELMVKGMLRQKAGQVSGRITLRALKV